MTITRRVFISSPRNEHLDERCRELKKAIIARINEEGYEPQAFGTTHGELVQGITWSPERARDVMKRCVGAAILGFPIGTCVLTEDGTKFPLVTEYCHYEGAIALEFGLPTLSVLEDGAGERGFFNRYAGELSIKYPPSATPDWIKQNEFIEHFNVWKQRLDKRCDVFFGYCSKAAKLAEKIRDYLTKELKLTVKDWGADFTAGGLIIQEIKNAANICTGGILLFTKDDMLQDEVAAPRDNVVFESGYFLGAKGNEKVLIILEEGAKMPVDLEGIIYALLPNQNSADPVKDKIFKFIQNHL